MQISICLLAKLPVWKSSSFIKLVSEFKVSFACKALDYRGQKNLWTLLLEEAYEIIMSMNLLSVINNYILPVSKEKKSNIRTASKRHNNISIFSKVINIPYGFY